MNLAERRAYDAAIECAALCTIALASVDGASFHLHMRDALREALHLHGALQGDGRHADASATRKVRDDIVTRVAIICARDGAPVWDAEGETGMNEHVERLLRECLDSVLMQAGGMCPAET